MKKRPHQPKDGHRYLRERAGMNQIVVASANAGKLAELNDLLRGSGIACIAQAQLGVDPIEETGLSFVENALLKARHAARATGLPALADDSGLCVDALGGAPGLHSARYGGTHGDATRNIARVLHELEGLPDNERGAHFHCTLVVLTTADDPQPLIAEASWAGHILEMPRGAGGFGYDPVFLDPLHGRTAAEMVPALKNRISHRGRALAKLQQRLAQLRSLPLV